MDIKISSIFLLILMLVYYGESANILGIFPIRSKSHHSINLSILKSLTSRGHNVTVFSYFKSKKSFKNYSNIFIGETTYPCCVDTVSIDEKPKYNGVLNVANVYTEMELSACHQIFKLPQMKKILDMEENSYDLIIAGMLCIPCYNLIAQILKIPLVIVYAPTVSICLDHMIGNPKNPAVLPLRSTPYSTHMNFFERVLNTLQYAFHDTFYHYRMEKELADISKKYLQLEFPSNEILYQKIAIILYNNHFSIINRASVPNAIDIAGIHIQEPNFLPPVSDAKKDEICLKTICKNKFEPVNSCHT